MNEFGIIDKYFNWEGNDSISIGVGDDAAIIQISEGKQLVTSVDTSIVNVHFPEDTAPYAIAFKSLAVNISDIAAMGGIPRWFTLALTLPEQSEVWLSGFSKGLKACANAFNVNLIGGDTTSGELSITITIYGEIDQSRALLRNGAKPNDMIYVTGNVGDAAGGLYALSKANASLPDANSHLKNLIQQLNLPFPRLTESKMIKEFASSCIDISDGLIQDLGHVISQSKCSAQLDINKIPLSEALLSIYPREQCQAFACYGGDDYELLFTVSANKVEHFERQYDEIKKTNPSLAKITRIGKITQCQDDIVNIRNQEGADIPLKGYQHF